MFKTLELSLNSSETFCLKFINVGLTYSVLIYKEVFSFKALLNKKVST